MKEATGELNMTVVIVIAVAILAAFFYTLIWPLIKQNYDGNASCAKAICTCDDVCGKTGQADCYVPSNKDKDNVASRQDYDPDSHFRCPWKG